jgi:hypothetical protein
MHNGEDSSDSDESGKAVGNCEDLDFDDMMASIENFIEEDPEFINELFGQEYLTRNRDLKISYETTKWGKLFSRKQPLKKWYHNCRYKLRIHNLKLEHYMSDVTSRNVLNSISSK